MRKRALSVLACGCKSEDGFKKFIVIARQSLFPILLTKTVQWVTNFR